MSSIRALTNEASALLAERHGDLQEALRRLRLARQLWTSIESRYHVARLRLEMVALQLELGDWRALRLRSTSSAVSSGNST
jgi:hypothetical protein